MVRINQMARTFFLIEQLSKRDLLNIVDTYGHGLSCQVMGEGYIKKGEEDVRGALFGDFLGIADDLMLQNSRTHPQFLRVWHSKFI